MRKEVFLWQRSFALRVQMVHQSYSMEDWKANSQWLAIGSCGYKTLCFSKDLKKRRRTDRIPHPLADAAFLMRYTSWPYSSS